MFAGKSNPCINLVGKRNPLVAENLIVMWLH